MAATPTPAFLQNVSNFSAVQIVPADTTTLKTLVTPGANGARVTNIIVNSTDTAAKDIQLVVTKSGTDFPLATIAIPLRSGDLNTTVPVSLFQHAMLVGLNTDNNGNRFIDLGPGSVLKVKTTSTVTAAKVISFFPQGADF